MTTTERWVQPDAIPRTPSRLETFLDAVEGGLETVKRTRTVADAAQRVQWERSPRPAPEVSRRAVGGPPSDPTADIVLDPGRLAVRASLRTADRHLLKALVHLRAAEGALTRGMSRWEGPEG